MSSPKECPGCIVCPVEVRGLYGVAFNLLNLVDTPDVERRARKMPERIEELRAAVVKLTPIVEKHFGDSPAMAELHAASFSVPPPPPSQTLELIREAQWEIEKLRRAVTSAKLDALDLVGMALRSEQPRIGTVASVDILHMLEKHADQLALSMKASPPDAGNVTLQDILSNPTQMFNREEHPQ